MQEGVDALILLCILLGVACWCDYGYRRIPNLLSAVILLTGFTRAYFMEGVEEIFRYSVTAGAVLLCMFPLFRIGTFGAGDLKLISLCAGYLHGRQILLFLFFTAVSAGMVSLVRFTKKEYLKERFLYLASYIREVLASGKWRLYFHDPEEQKRGSMCLAGPVLISILMNVGGLY